MKLKAIDLFAGCGGLTAGLKRAGFNVIGAVEIDHKARLTYSNNHGEVPLISADIRDAQPEKILKDCSIARGELDLLAGCPPCQGFSTLRARQGHPASEDIRNDLIDEFARLSLALLPKLIMMENVPALARFDKFKNFVSMLEDAGYNVVFKTLNVRDFGVPQRRKRLILSANRTGIAKLAAPLKHDVTVRSAIGNLKTAGSSGDLLHDMPSPRRSARIQSLIKAIPKDGGSRNSLPPELQLACHKRTTGFNDVYGRMKWDDVSPTITGGCINPSKGRFIHPYEDRPITLREAAILQGFDENYKFDIRHGKESIALMIGNALPPPFIEAHAQAMAEGLVHEQN